MKTLIAIPCMDMVHTSFLRCLLGLRKTGDVKYSITSSSLVYDARNTLARHAVEGGFDRILWLDSDMEFEADMMERLSADMDEGLDFVCGLYFRRKPPVKPVIYRELGLYKSESGEVTPGALPYEDYPRDELFEIAAAGFGGVMMTVDLVRKVTEKFGLPFSPMLGFGEDLTFCAHVQQVGAKMHCDSRVKFGHIGLGAITEDIYLAGLEAAKKGAGKNA